MTSELNVLDPIILLIVRQTDKSKNANFVIMKDLKKTVKGNVLVMF